MNTSVATQQRVLLTSVCGPLGPRHGDGPSVGYELLHGQVTRAQGIFSPRAVHLNFSLNYIAENLDTPAVVLQYPTRRDLIRELKRGSYDYVGVSFILALFHRMKETVALIRQYSPQSKIVLGGYGTVVPDDVLRPYADHVCREEGVGFFRRLLGRSEIPMPYKHPQILSTLKVFSMTVSRTGMIFAGLGCPNGCDFCCTSHFFKRKHIRLLPEGRDIYAVVEDYLEKDPEMSFVILDEDFLLNKTRALAFRDCVLKGGKALSIFVFSSIKAISQYTVEEILEMGIDGFWIGYEGTRSGYGKQQGRPAADILREFREHGITVLASMILGFDYQNREVIADELAGLMDLKPSFSQFLIYGPTPGTPFYERILREGLLRSDLAANKETYYRKCDGFTTMINHPTLSPEDIEALQRWCYDEDFQRLGPSLFRTVEAWLLGYQKLKDSPRPLLRKRAERFAREIRNAYPIFGVGSLLGPNRAVRRWIRDLEHRVHAEIGRPTLKERAMSLAAFPAAFWTFFTLKAGLFQRPRVRRMVYGMPEADAAARGLEVCVEEPALP
ncbi:MAG: cobalamin B12-binding domain-containing protein [Elusimicrobia bacterium]|nr:cobalamin B12-binding domain-containing protein [Elusimicrobiota bacterium]